MLEILFDLLRAGSRGRGWGFRVQVKPSWSARVYGTYSILGRHILLATVFSLAMTALFGRLVAVNLAEPTLNTERDALRRNVAHRYAMREVGYPALERSMVNAADRLGEHARIIETVLGVAEADAHRGIGSMGQEPAPTISAVQALSSLRLSSLERRFRALSSALLAREADLRFTPSIVPIADADFVTTSPFGRRISPFTQLAEMHRGLDLAADLFTRVVATADGVVAHVELDAHRSGMGIYAVIDHGGLFQSYYGHCSRVFVAPGEEVKRGQLIAELGSTGRSTGPHVHYEVRRGGVPIDPRDFLLLDARYTEGEKTWFH